jgi:hypothetical protein
MLRAPGDLEAQVRGLALVCMCASTRLRLGVWRGCDSGGGRWSEDAESDSTPVGGIFRGNEIEAEMVK